jgi:hypothetical protein
MIEAGGYILRVSEGRRDTLLGYATPNQAVGEPVASFPLSARAPLIVFAAFDLGAITHVADGRKGIASGTKMVRLNLSSIQELAVPISHDRLLAEVPPRIRPVLSRRLREGGLLAPASFRAVIEAVASLAPDVAERLARFSAGRADAVARLTDRAREALAQQKESVGLALKISGLDTRQLLAWSPPLDGEPTSFLDGLPEARVREDAMVAHDLGQVPGFEAIKAYSFAARMFEAKGTRLTVILANKLPLEQQFGTDLIYYNETYRSFVMVQYKAMERAGSGKAEFRLPSPQLDAEIARMDATLAAISALSDDESRDSFRLHGNPFFLKLCARHVFNPDDGGLFPGMYLPLDYWRRLVLHEATEGTRGGRLVTFENVGRKLSESEFIPLVAGAWVGTGISQSTVLERVVREVIENGKAITLAVQSRTGKL